MQSNPKFVSLADGGKEMPPAFGSHSKKKGKPTKSKEYDFFMKIVLVGQSNVGKTALMLRFTDDKFNSSYVNTIGVDFRFRTLTVGGKRVKIQIWDTAGQEKFRTVTSTYYRGSDAILLCYDITDKQSYEQLLTYWADEINKQQLDIPFLVLVGTKADRESERQVESLPGPFCVINLGGQMEKNARVIETSAKSSKNVYEIFEELAGEFIKMKEAKRQARQTAGPLTDQKLHAIRESAEEHEKSAGDGTSKLTKTAANTKPPEKSGCKC